TTQSSNAEAVQGTNNGFGTAVQGTNTGNGRAGYFSINNPTNDSGALAGITNGTGNGVYGQAAYLSGYGGSFTNTGGGLALHAGGDAEVTGRLGIGTDSPAVKLDVRGEVKLGPSGQYYAASGEGNNPLRIIYGRIRVPSLGGGNGAILAGSGFTISN